jgi:hypothetical protein
VRLGGEFKNLLRIGQLAEIRFWTDRSYYVKWDANGDYLLVARASDRRVIRTLGILVSLDSARDKIFDLSIGLIFSSFDELQLARSGRGVLLHH